MTRGFVLLSGAFLLLSLLFSAPAAQAQEHWAGMASNDAADAPVVWGSSKEEVTRKALAACHKMSDTCGDRPATTPDTNDIFTVMCCTTPRHSCAVGVESTMELARDQVQKVFDDAGFSHCQVIKHISATTGRRID